MLEFCGVPNGCSDVGNANNFFIQFSLVNLNFGRVILVLYRPIPNRACKKVLTLNRKVHFDSTKRLKETHF